MNIKFIDKKKKKNEHSLANSEMPDCRRCSPGVSISLHFSLLYFPFISRFNLERILKNFFLKNLCSAQIQTDLRAKRLNVLQTNHLKLISVHPNKNFSDPKTYFQDQICNFKFLFKSNEKTSFICNLLN